MIDRRKLMFGTVAAGIAATVPLSEASATPNFTPFEIQFYFEDKVGYLEHDVTDGVTIHRASLITIPFDEYGEGVIDVADFSPASRNHIMLAIRERTSPKYIAIFKEYEDVLIIKLHKRLSLPYLQRQQWGTPI